MTLKFFKNLFKEMQKIKKLQYWDSNPKIILFKKNKKFQRVPTHNLTHNFSNTHLFKRKTSCVSEIAALSFKQWMWLVSNDEDNVSWNFSFCLIALLLERNLCPTLPTRLYRYAHILVLFLRCSIRLQDTSRYFHLFHTTMINFL